ncbi:MAG: hypothetical protein IM477_14810 [Microcystis sp. M090S1]|jgi:HPt (histidine-containing phosphotransfer) domain-containing protein|uniref:hypothetical protein n=1 Tax=Microcystis sp. M090S1 TaxID=2771135 RepID=UPI00258A01E4|nr:hypothetical protein [Microcystis sp. M090S1]MCA2813738.1 hypothetical protein [Microcystis sp. M090S1]
MDKHDIEKIGVREFRSELPKYLYGETPVEVLRHAHTVGFYFPVKQGSKSADIAALQAVAAQLEYLLSQKGLSEDDIVREFRQLREADRANQRKELDE